MSQAEEVKPSDPGLVVSVAARDLPAVPQLGSPMLDRDGKRIGELIGVRMDGRADGFVLDYRLDPGVNLDPAAASCGFKPKYDLSAINAVLHRIQLTAGKSGLWRNEVGMREGKYLVVRRDGTVPAWEWFVLGQRDPAAPAALRAYSEEAARLGMFPGYVDDVRKLADQWEHDQKTGWCNPATEKPADPDAVRHRTDDPETLAALRRELNEPVDQEWLISQGWDWHSPGWLKSPADPRGLALWDTRAQCFRVMGMAGWSMTRPTRRDAFRLVWFVGRMAYTND